MEVSNTSSLICVVCVHVCFVSLLVSRCVFVAYTSASSARRGMSLLTLPLDLNAHLHHRVLSAATGLLVVPSLSPLLALEAGQALGIGTARGNATLSFRSADI